MVGDRVEQPGGQSHHQQVQVPVTAIDEQWKLDAYHPGLDATLAGPTPAPASPHGHQFQSPPRRSSAGPMTMRTSVASISTATAKVNPSILMTSTSPNVNAVNTTTIIVAALVIRPPVFATPSAIAWVSERPLLLASSTRATRKTS